MGRYVDGEWITTEPIAGAGGEFIRKPTQFRSHVSTDGSTPYAPEPGRYHLYVSYACPWAHRTLIARKLRKLEDVISISVAHPYVADDEGWAFREYPGCVPDLVNNARFVREIYKKGKDDYTGRITVPVMWDRQTGTIVSNESVDIVRMFDLAFREYGDPDVDLHPEDLRERIDDVIQALYAPINDGVYRCGFAGSQEAYDAAVTRFFDALEHWEAVLGEQRYLVGDRLTAADLCMFTTLFRFVHVYHTHFKVNLWQLWDYPNLWGFTRDVYQTPGVAETCFVDHIKEHYFRSHQTVNPRRIVPKGPVVDFEEPHSRG